MFNVLIFPGYTTEFGSGKSSVKKEVDGDILISTVADQERKLGFTAVAYLTKDSRGYKFNQSPKTNFRSFFPNKKHYASYSSYDNVSERKDIEGAVVELLEENFPLSKKTLKNIIFSNVDENRLNNLKKEYKKAKNTNKVKEFLGKNIRFVNIGNEILCGIIDDLEDFIVVGKFSSTVINHNMYAIGKKARNTCILVSFIDTYANDGYGARVFITLQEMERLEQAEREYSKKKSPSTAGTAYSLSKYAKSNKLHKEAIFNNSLSLENVKAKAQVVMEEELYIINSSSNKYDEKLNAKKNKLRRNRASRERQSQQRATLQRSHGRHANKSSRRNYHGNYGSNRTDFTNYSAYDDNY